MYILSSYILSSRPRTRAVVALAASGLLLGTVAPLLAEAQPAATAPGRVVSWGGPAEMQDVIRPPEWLDDAVAVSASDARGSYSNLALRADGTVVGWGLNRYQETTPPDDLHDVVAIDSGAGFSVALRSDGSVVTWGANDAGQLDVPEDLGPVTSVSAGGYFSYRGIGVPEGVCGFALALRPDGTVVRWGRDADGLECTQLGDQLDPPAGLSDVVAISAGSLQALALKSDGTVVSWGFGVMAGLDGIPPAQWTDVVAISAGSGNSLGLRRDGTVLAYGIWGETGPPRVSDVAAISASNVDVFLRTDTTIGTHTNVVEPPAGTGYVAVSAGYDYGLAIQSAGAPSPSPSAEPSPTGAPIPLPTVSLPPSPSPSESASPSPSPSPSPTPEPGSDGTVPLPSVPALGSAEIQPAVDYNLAGSAEAFQYTASRDASVDRFNVYLDAGNKAETVIVGVYDDRDHRPGTLVSTGRTTRAVSGAWNTIAIDGLRLEARRHYWLAVLGPTDTGIIRFRNVLHGSGGPTKSSAQTNLSVQSGLPGDWKTGKDFADSPMSAYLD